MTLDSEEQATQDFSTGDDNDNNEDNNANGWVDECMMVCQRKSFKSSIRMCNQSGLYWLRYVVITVIQTCG